MRKQLDKLKKSNSTHAERRFAEGLKNLRIPFRAKVRIDGREVDFLIGKYAVDIDGHTQDVVKNVRIVEAGFIPVHYSNREVNDPVRLNSILNYYAHKFP